MTNIPVIPQLSTNPNPVEIRAAFERLRIFFAQVQKEGGFALSNDVLNSLNDSISDAVDQIPTSDTVDIPTPITDLVATGAFNQIILTWVNGVYNGHSHTEIHRAAVDDLGVAVNIGDTTAQIYADIPPDSSLSSTYYYWVRNVNTNGVPGPFNAVSGVSGSTADDPAYILELMLGELGYSHFDIANGVFPITTVSSLPTLPNALYPVGVHVYLTTDGKLYRNKAESWTADVASTDIDGQLLEAQIANGAITTVKLVDDIITAAKLAADSVTTVAIIDDAIVSDKILANAVTSVKIVDNAITAGKVAANAITAVKIIANAITADKIAANAVSADKIATNAITSDKIAANAITAVKIIADAITADKIAANAVEADSIAANAITSDKIAANAITAVKIVADAITAGKLAANAVVADNITANAVTAGKIATGAIVAGDGVISNAAIANAHIIDGTITNAKIQSLAADKITTGYLAAARVLAGSLDADKITSRTITADRIAAGVLTAYEIAANTITANEIAANTLTANEIAADAITASEIAANAVTAAKIAAATITATEINGLARINGNKISSYAVVGVFCNGNSTNNYTHNMGRHCVGLPLDSADTVSASDVNNIRIANGSDTARTCYLVYM